VSTWQGLRMIADRTMWPIIGSLFHPVYMLVNAKVLGGIIPDPAVCGEGASEDTLESFDCITAKTYLASFGLASSTMGIMLLAVGTCFVIGLTNVIPQAYGAE